MKPKQPKPFDLARFTVKIRRDLPAPVRPEAEAVDGKTYTFSCGWKIQDGIYQNETAWLPRDKSYPHFGPIWIASGDLEVPNE